MGCRENVTMNTMPKQGSHLNKEVNVCFNYDTSNLIKGKIVRDDVEEPGLAIISLADGRFITTDECQYQLV